MYKIYINETPLWLVNTADVEGLSLPEGEVLVARYHGKSKFLLQYIDMLEKSDRFRLIVLHAEKAKVVFKDFKRLFRRIDAAGGLVFNQDGEALLIFRRGFWDLPKGKIDPGEGKKAAAIREVQEETGIQSLELASKLGHTYHTYKLSSGKRVLKKTYWYLMSTPDRVLIPQTEEDIELAVWRDLNEFLMEERKIYKTILDVIDLGLSQKK